MIGNYGQGGQKDSDLDAKFRLVKFAWQALDDNVLKPTTGTDIFHTNLALSKTTRNLTG